MSGERERRETEDYPGFVVCDNRRFGSITLGHTRQAVRDVLSYAMTVEGWDDAIAGYGWDEDPEGTIAGVSLTDLGNLLDVLFDLRGDYGRLVLAMANAERRGGGSWPERPRIRKPVVDLMRSCLADLESRSASQVGEETK